MDSKAGSAAARGCFQGVVQAADRGAYRPAVPRSRHPASRRVAVAAGLLVTLAATAALASRTLYLARDELICDAARIACIDGTLTYDVNERLLWLRGRVRSATMPGVLQITVRGSNRLGHVRFAPMDVALRGRASEIVDFRMIPDWPDVANWSIDRIEYLTSGDPQR